MDAIYIVLMIAISAGAVFASTFFTLKQYFENKEKLEKYQVRRLAIEKSTPQTIQAYERLILLLERISPENLVMRTQKSGMSARAHHFEMLKSIRQEFDHNIAQQLYISDQAWRLVKQSKDESIRLINIAATKLGDQSSATDLSKMVLSMMTQLENIPTEVAIKGLKREFKGQF